MTGARPLLLVTLLLVLVAAGGTGDEEPRPVFHFTPENAWMNDPNGLVFDGEVYHLYYQHNPDDIVWGPMHWGHATSTDLVNWEHQPIALAPDDLGTIFSGSAVIDSNNTAGFGEDALVAAFTYFDDPRQSQAIAYSVDGGQSFTKFVDNPVVVPPSGIRNFRDPKVFWFDDGSGDGHWVMALGAGVTVLFFTSDDLVTWEPSGGFGPPNGATCGVWETPDLFELPVDGGAETAWVLAVAIGDCAPAGGSGVQYFVGDFDGETFTNGNPPDTVLWVDHGADFYAPQSWNGLDDRRVWIGWMNNWRYATRTPAETWRGAMTAPRELSLTQTDDGLKLAQTPAVEIERFHGASETVETRSLSDTTLAIDGVSAAALDVTVEFDVDPQASQRFGLRLSGPGAEEIDVGYAFRERLLFVDRARSGSAEFAPDFAAAHSVAVEPIDGILAFRLLVDRSSVEVFSADGTAVITDLMFPSATPRVEVFSDGQVELVSLVATEIDPSNGRTVPPAMFWLGGALAVIVLAAGLILLQLRTSASEPGR